MIITVKVTQPVFDQLVGECVFEGKTFVHSCRPVEQFDGIKAGLEKQLLAHMSAEMQEAVTENNGLFSLVQLNDRPQEIEGQKNGTEFFTDHFQIGNWANERETVKKQIQQKYGHVTSKDLWDVYDNISKGKGPQTLDDLLEERGEAEKETQGKMEDISRVGVVLFIVFIVLLLAVSAITIYLFAL